MLPAVIGAAVHSGWAVLVALGNARDDPRILSRSRIELIDAGVPGAKQPYHAAESMPLAEARAHVEAFAADALTKARAALLAAQRELDAQRYQLQSVGVLDSSGRSGETLAAILASHTLIHTADGNHFRAAIAAASTQCGLRVHRIAAKTLDQEAPGRLSLSQNAIDRVLASFGRQVGAPWGADQKQAALLAWTLL